MKLLRLFASLQLLALALLLSGCGPGAPKVTTADNKAFETASPELKQDWAQSQAAAGTNNYTVALVTLRSMLAQNLSIEQIEAVQNAMRACNAKLMKAVENGDPAAQKALEALKSSGGRASP
jgi:hypothetical protein